MNTLFKKFLYVSSPVEPQLSEEECLIAEIKAAVDKLQYAWNRFDYAAPEYVELAVLELLLAETQYSLLHKRYRIMLGISKPPYAINGHLQNHAFYGSLFSTASR